MSQLVLILATLLVGYVVGSILERRHFASIREREVAMIGKAVAFTDEGLPPLPADAQLRLIAGSTVVSIDAFKKLASSLYSFFGGRLVPYESLVDRARREAMLRLREKAHAMGATMIFGVRYETSMINDGDPRRTAGVELVAYGTAVIPGLKAA